MKDTHHVFYGFLMTSLLFATACNNHPTEEKIMVKTKNETPPANAQVAETKRAPVINIGDTLSLKRLVLTIKDSAATIESVHLKLAEIYGIKLAAIIKKENLKTTGAPMAWHKGTLSPYFFEAGIPVDRKPSRLPAGMYIKQTGVDSVVVAHFYGPYDLLPQAYEALGNWVKDHKKRTKAAPYEIYIDDPADSAGKLKDPYKVQTDIVFTWR